MDTTGKVSMEDGAVKPAMTMAKAVGVFTNKHSCDMVDRHIRAVNRVSAANKQGFEGVWSNVIQRSVLLLPLLLKDLCGLLELLHIMSKQLQSRPQYQESLLILLRLCGKPFLKQKVSDENIYTADVLHLLALLGKIAVSTNDATRVVTVQTLASLYTTKCKNSNPEDDVQVTKLSYRAALIERSMVAKSLVEALGKCGDFEAKAEVLLTMKLLSTSATNCNHMLSANLSKYLCDVIAVTQSKPSSRLVFIGTEILWNLLENGSEILIGKELTSIECISTLKHLFRELIAMSHTGMKVKQLRNDLIMICLRIAQLCPSAPFVETGFFSDICTYSVFTEESGSRSHLIHGLGELKNFKLSKDHHEDFELKKSLICLLASVGTDPAAAKIMASKKVMRGLLSFVVQNDKAGSDWNAAQFEELQLLILSSLCTIGPLLTVDYMTCQGNTRLLLLIEWAIKNDMTFVGHGNSFHGEGSRGSKVAQLRYSLRLLLSICNCADDAILQDMHEQGAIPMLINILKNFRKIPKSHANDPVLLEMQADILLILSCICELDTHKKELFGGYDGVNVLVSYLKNDTSKFESGLGHGRLLLAATDCVWCCVIGNQLVEESFLEHEGAFILLDLLKDCPVNMKNLVLGVLVDLCENHKATHHVASWKTIDGCSTWSLLAQLWKAEEWDMEVPRAHLSTLAGTSQPLVGKEQNDCGMPPIPTHCPSASITDVTENMRAKIYTLCCKMGFQYMDDDLSVEDKITMCIIENYLDFKTGEVWYEVAGELAQEGLRPVTPDQECLVEIMQAHEAKAENTLKQQHELIDEQRRIEEGKEAKFYDKMKDYHLVNENAKLDFQKFVERTSNYEALKRAKAKLHSSLDASRRSCVAIGDRFHATENTALNTTVMCGRRVTISTTPRKLLIAPVVPSSLNISTVDQDVSET